MRSLFVAFAILAAAGAAQADTLLTYKGPAFDNVSCNRRCHFTHFSFLVRVPGTLPPNGLVQFCNGTGCANSLPVMFADGQSRLTQRSAGDYAFIGTVQLDQSGAQISSAVVDGAQVNQHAGILLYMAFGQLTGGDALGGNLHNANVDASASGIGVWTIKPLRTGHAMRP